MSKLPFSASDLGTASVLQLTLWTTRPEMRELTAIALTAFGSEEQSSALHALGQDCVRYLQFESAELESASYPHLAGFQITHSVLSRCTDSGRSVEKRSVRILTPHRNGPIVRGFGDSDNRREITAVFSHLSTQTWTRLVAKLGWDPNDLRSACAAGIAFYPTADPEMTLLAPPYWT